MLLRHLIGAALRRARLRQGRTLREVADAAQVSMPYLSEVERGRKEASSEVLAAICRALGLRLSELLEDVRQDLTRLEPQRAAAAPARLCGGAVTTQLSLGPQHRSRGDVSARCRYGQAQRHHVSVPPPPLTIAAAATTWSTKPYSSAS
jgi:transcriptional regulator with XRE-family HTH domain